MEIELKEARFKIEEFESVISSSRSNVADLKQELAKIVAQEQATKREIIEGTPFYYSILINICISK